MPFRLRTLVKDIKTAALKTSMYQWYWICSTSIRYLSKSLVWHISQMYFKEILCYQFICQTFEPLCGLQPWSHTPPLCCSCAEGAASRLVHQASVTVFNTKEFSRIFCQETGTSFSKDLSTSSHLHPPNHHIHRYLSTTINRMPMKAVSTEYNFLNPKCHHEL